MYVLYTQQNSLYLTENPESSTSYKDSTANDDIVVNKWDATFYSKLNIYDFDFNKIFPGKHESGMFEVDLVDTGNQQSNKEVDWQKVFYVFWKYKNEMYLNKKYIRFSFKGIKKLNSNLYLKYMYLKYCPSLDVHHYHHSCWIDHPLS